MIISRLHWILIFAVTLSISCSRPNLIENVKDDAVVAVINGHNISAKELRSEINLLMRQFRVRDLNELTPEEKLLLKMNGLNQIIQNVLLNLEAVSNRVSLTRNEYTDALNAVKSEYQGDSFAKYLEVEGIPHEVWENKFKNNMLFKKLIEAVVNSKILISDEEIKKYYDDHQFEFQKGEQVRALHIMAESESKIRSILKELKANREDFSGLAQTHSLGPEGSLGGDLGYFEAGQMPEEFDGVFKLNVGQTSDTIKTPYGYHLFKVVDKKPASQMNFDDSYKIIYNKLMREEQSREFEEWVIKLKNKSDIEIKHEVLAKIN